MREKLPFTVERIVDALCMDYDRRERIIADYKCDAEHMCFFSELNRTIDESICESCEEGIRSEMLTDLKLRRGYNRSMMYGISEGAYKRRKRMAKFIIAKKLNYI